MLTLIGPSIDFHKQRMPLVQVFRYCSAFTNSPYKHEMIPITPETGCNRDGNKNLREQMLSLANSRDANGQYIFAGYKVETQPFVEDPDGVVQHFGDRGVHTLQISDNQRIATTLDGADVFLRIPQDEGVVDVFSTIDAFIQQLDEGEMDDDHIDRMGALMEHFSLQQTKLALK